VAAVISQVLPNNNDVDRDVKEFNDDDDVSSWPIRYTILALAKVT
jgi:hypothetical protein